MEALANALIAGLELIEAEGRSLRSALVGLVMRLCLAVVGAACVGTGMVFLIRAAHLALATVIGEIWASVVTGALFAVLGGALYLIARSGRKSKPKPAEPHEVDPKDKPEEGVRYDSPLQPQPAVG